MADWHNKILAVTFKELTTPNPEAKDGAVGMSVISESNYKWHVRQGNIKVIRSGKGLGNPALIEYESLPMRFKDRFLMIWGDPYELVEESMMKDEIIIDRKARKFYEEHLLPDGTHIPDEFQAEYVQNASVLNLLIEMLNHRKAMRKALNNGMRGVWSTIYGTVDKLRNNPGHTLPKSRARLRDKINEYKKKGYECLVSGKLGNTNTVKITEEGGTFLVMQKRRRVPIMSDEQILLEYNRVAPAYNWKQLESVASVTNYLNDPENMQRWYDAIHGELKAYQKFGYKFKTCLPSLRDALWYGDGTKLNLYYKAYEGGRLVVKTTQVYEVMDAYSETLLGYHISDTENYTAQYNAYRMAVETSKARPFEIVVDNQGGHKKLDNTGFMSRISRVQRNTMPYRGSGKSIEAVFGRFQSQILHQDWRFTGQNITAKSDKSRANLEFIAANKENLYTLDELKAAYKAAREEWNSKPHPATGTARKEMYLSSMNPEAQGVDRLDMIELFWLMTPKPATFTASGIEIQIEGRKYTYDVYADGGIPDLNFRKKNIGKKFYTQYDPNDLTQVRLYEMTASGLRYVTDALPYFEVKRALQEATHESSTFVRRVLDLEKEIRISTYFNNIEIEHEHGVAPEQFGLNRPKLKGISMNSERRRPACTQTQTRKKDVETVEIGAYEKEVSNMTYDEAAMLDKL
ncbi:MAG TPA: kinase [Porphyromonadaceae bacterium]|nr:kinase [Porphyromonadaceae bacterium]